MNKSQFSGLVLVNKPKNISSFSVISRLRLLTGIKKIGHCGTLDPFATGLLPVLFGRYTRLASYLENEDKVYEALLTLGKRTDTLDVTGEVIAQMNSQELAERVMSGELEASLKASLKKNFIGKIEQTPPMYSAVKHQGKPLYAYAREGQKVKRKTRSIEIYRAELSTIEKNHKQWQMKLKLHCQKGTYVRSFIDDLAKSVNACAYAEELKRTKIGSMSLADKLIELDDLFEIFNEAERNQALIRKIIQDEYFYPLNQALAQVPSYQINQAQLINVSHGQKFKIDRDRLKKIIGEKDLANYDKVIIQLVFQGEIVSLAKIQAKTLEFDGYEKVLISNEDVPFILNKEQNIQERFV